MPVDTQPNLKPPSQEKAKFAKEIKQPEFFVTVKQKVEGILSRWKGGNHAKNILQELSSLEIPEDQKPSTILSPEVTPKNPHQSSETTLNTPQQDQQEISILTQQIQQLQTESSPVPESAPKKLFPDRPSLYDRYHQKYEHERKTIKGAITRSTNIRRLQKEGFKRSDAKEIYDNLRSRGIKVDQIYIPKEDFYGNLYRNEPAKYEEIITLLKNAPKIIDRNNSVGVMEQPEDFNVEYLSDRILTLTDEQYQEKQQQINSLFFLDRGGARDLLLQPPFDKETIDFINYFKSEFLTQQNQKIDFSIFGKDILALLKEKPYERQKIISTITQKIILSEINQNHEIRIFQLAQDTNIHLSSEEKRLSNLSKLSSRQEQKFLVSIYQKFEEGKIDNIEYDKLINQYRSTPTLDFFKQFIASSENYSSHSESTFFEKIANFDCLDQDFLKSYLTPEIFSSFSLEDQKFWTKILAIGKVPYLNFVVRNKSFIDSLVDQNNKPTKELLIKLIESKSDFITISKVCTPELVNNIPDSDPDKVFFTLLTKMNSLTTYDLLLKNKESILEKINSSPDPKETLTQYVSVIDQINSSPSKEILKIKNQILVEILGSPNPLETYQKISDIFVKNNLPMVGKIYRVFNVLYPPERVSEMLLDPKLSRVLVKNHSSHLRESIIFNDLLKANLGSGELSLVSYLNLLNQNSSVLEKAKSGEQLSLEENRQLSFFIKKLDTLYESSLLSRIQDEEPLDTPTLQLKIDDIYKKYQVKEGQTLSDRVAEMYLYGLGLKTITQALDYIRESQKTAHNRNLNQASYSISVGDLVKNLESANLGSILNFGSVAGEYLGANAGSDMTPFDTDTIKSDGEYPIEEHHQIAPSGYGDIYIVIKNRNQFQDTTNDPNPEYDINKLEIFQSGVVTPNHYGVRTGFPSSEIDFIITKNGEPKILENIFYEIAKHGVYIPVLDKDGKQLFTPQDYQRYRRSFDGVKQFNGDQIQVEVSTPQDPFYKDILSIKNEITQNASKEVSMADSQIKSKIKSILNSLDISLKDEFDTSLLGCRLYNIGSSGRRTNLPNDFDFDYNLVLDFPSYGKLEQLKQQIISAFSHQGEIPSAESSQIRLSGVADFGPNPIDFDIGLNNTASTLIFASHEAIEQKLNSIRENYGESTYQEVIANIILAKKILKENHAYKKGSVQDGGFGGIGTENWILANNGSIKKAFETFWEAAHDGNRILTLDEFRKKYFILDPGENLRDTGRNHDNFIFTLTETGYESMLKAIAKYQT